MRRLIAPVLAASLVLSPTAAMGTDRAPAAINDGEEISGSPWLWIVLIFASVGVLIALVSGDDQPVSP